jgi:hypothetical protein
MTPDEKDICVKVYLSGADWLGLKDMAESHGLSQSACIRQMVRHAIEHHARKQFAAERRAADRTATDPD